MARILSISLVVAAAAFGCSTKNSEKFDTTVVSVNEYPDIILRLADGREVSTKKLEGNNLFIFFQPDCDHCQEEAIFIEQRLGEFKDYTLYFISSAPMESIIGFAENFRLDKKNNVLFAWSSTEGVLNHYGPIQTPSVYIYSDGRLKHSFNGQTDVGSIVEAL